MINHHWLDGQIFHRVIAGTGDTGMVADDAQHRLAIEVKGGERTGFFGHQR